MSIWLLNSWIAQELQKPRQKMVPMKSFILYWINLFSKAFSNQSHYSSLDCSIQSYFCSFLLLFDRTDCIAGSTHIGLLPKNVILRKSAMKIIVPPIESELSFSTGVFSNNYDVRDRMESLNLY